MKKDGRLSFIIHHSAFSTCFSAPAHDFDARAAPDFRLDFKFVNKPTRAGESFAESAARGEAVAHCGGDVWDAGACVFEDESKPFAPRGTADGLRNHATAARVLDDVARQLGGDGCEPRLVNHAKAERGGYGARLAARDGDVVVRLKGD
jgi:hypothetical protein